MLCSVCAGVVGIAVGACGGDSSFGCGAICCLTKGRDVAESQSPFRGRSGDVVS